MAKQKKQSTFKSLGVSRQEAENIRAALQLLEETEQAEEKEALREREREAAQNNRNLSFLKTMRKLVILYKNAEQYPREEREHKWNERYETLLDQMQTAFGVDRVKQQFEVDYPKYRVGEDLSHGSLR